METENPRTRSKKTSSEKKAALLALAEAGVARPNVKTKLGSALANYSNNKSKSYDDKFLSKLKGIAPKWFRNKPVTLVEG